MTVVRAKVRILLVGAALMILPAGCRQPPEAMDRERFITTYVELRTAALQNPGGQIPPAQRDEILTRNGVTEDDLLEFAEVHGRDVDYMAAVWGEVERRLHPQDTVQTPSSPP